MMPILTALAIVGIALIAVLVLRLAGGNVAPEEAQIGRAVVGQNDALQREDYTDFRTFTCLAQQGTETQVLADQRRSVAEKGARVVDDITDLAVTGDRAIATVSYHFEKPAADSADDKLSVPMVFVREDGEWKVCSAGPR